MRKKTVAAVLAIVVIAGATAAASYSHWRDMGGNNDPARGWLGLWAEIHANSDPIWYGYPSGPSYVEFRVEGQSVSECTGGFRNGSGCADNAHGTGLGGWYSHAQGNFNIVPLGCYSAPIKVYIDNQLRESYSFSKCFQDPPGEDPAQECANQGAGWQWDGDECVYHSPIVIATGKGQAYKFTKQADGVFFDINADGRAELVSWTEFDSEVAFLAIDRNGNGTIDNGSELFGDVTVPGVGNGFAALRQLAGSGTEGSLTASNPFFGLLLLWHDRNHDGVSQADELSRAGATLEAIGLGYSKTDRKDGNGNQFRYRGWARKLPASFLSLAAGGDNIVWGTATTPDNIVWGTSATPDDREAREFSIYDVFVAVR